MSTKALNETQAKQITFFLSLLKVLLDRKEDLDLYDKLFTKNLKNKGKLFFTEIENQTTSIFKRLRTDEEKDQFQELYVLIQNNLDKLFLIYEKDAKQINSKESSNENLN